MCGLIGGDLFNAETAAEALRQIAHRGRDAEGLVCEDGVWLGHRRLAIQDTGLKANQPLVRGEIALVYNGELWRHTMDSHPDYSSDTTLIADLYCNHRDANIGGLVKWACDLDGMFACAIHDRTHRRIVLARDRMGRIPLYYVVFEGGGMAFASEAKALTVPLELGFAGNNPRAQKNSEVKLFPPGSVAVYDIATGAISCHCFACLRTHHRSVVDVDAKDMGAACYAEGIQGCLRAAVHNESISDVPICTILSGGVDSTIVTALLAEVVPDLRAYTVSVGPSDGKDDLAFARRAADAIGVPLTEVILSRDDVLHGLEEAVWVVEDDRWVQVAPAVPQIALARQIGGDGYKVVFGGEGSDELFGSYGDVRRWSWQPQQYHNKRVQLCERLHDNNLIRGNKAMMCGTVELRTPFLDRELVDFCLRIPTQYRSSDSGRGSVMKPLLREAFRGLVSDDLLMRKKVTFQEGAHSDFLKGYRGTIRGMFAGLFSQHRMAGRHAARPRRPR